MAPDPDDIEILHKLASRPRADWDRLFSLLDDLVQEGDLTRFQPDGYPVYSECVNEIHELLYRLEVVVPFFDWPSWARRQLYVSGQGLADAPAADAARFATVLLRAERFSDGVIAQAITDGALVALLRRLRQWYRLEVAPLDE